MAYENIRIVGHHGNIYDDSGYIHMDIEANFITFEPLNGQKLVVGFTLTPNTPSQPFALFICGPLLRNLIKSLLRFVSRRAE